MFAIGMALAIAGVYLFFDSVRVVAGEGFITGMVRRGAGRGGRLIETTSMGIVFAPLFIGVFALFVNSHRKWAWWLTYIGIAVLAVEILSRISFFMDTKLTHLIGMLILLAAGCGLMFRSYRSSGITVGNGEEID